MKVFTARQAIFNRRQHTVAYEVFFRDGIENVFPKGVDPTVASSRLIVNQHLNVGITAITNGKRALVNFSQQGLIDRIPSLMPPNDIVIEVLEDVEPTDEVYEACRELFHKGYRMALDDFLYHKDWERFLNFTRLLKFDIQNTPLEEIAPLVEKFKKRKGLKLLAEKVETQEEFMLAKKMGFDFFQGYFFCKPEMIENKDIEAQHAMTLIIYHEALKPFLNYTKLASYFEQDVSLSYKLLRFTNSGLFVLKEPIESIKQALVYLGEEQARKFICLIATAHLRKNKPVEIIRMSIIRARFCEQIAKHVAPGASDSAFMVGLFSMIDALLDTPMASLLAKLPLSEDIKTALLGEKSLLLNTLELVKAYESGSWWAITKKAELINIPQDDLPDMHRNATLWSETYETIS